jgi:hypothetical protein
MFQEESNCDYESMIQVIAEYENRIQSETTIRLGSVEGLLEEEHEDIL